MKCARCPSEAVEGRTRCQPCAVAHRVSENDRIARRRGPSKQKCGRCFQPGHRAPACAWQPSIYRRPEADAAKQAERVNATRGGAS